MIGVEVLPADVTIPRALSAFDGDGRLTRPEDVAAVERIGQMIVSSAERAPAAA